VTAREYQELMFYASLEWMLDDKRSIIAGVDPIKTHWQPDEQSEAALLQQIESTL
jgi:hypothetical protein